MKQITKKLRETAQALLDSLEEISIEKRKADTKSAEIRQQLRELVVGFDLPRLTKSSVYLPLDSGKSLLFTRPSKNETIDPEIFRQEIGNELFHEICTITEIDFDMDKWRELREQELVFDSQLASAIKDTGAKEVTLRVSIKKTEDLKDE